MNSSIKNIRFLSSPYFLISNHLLIHLFFGLLCLFFLYCVSICLFSSVSRCCLYFLFLSYVLLFAHFLFPSFLFLALLCASCHWAFIVLLFLSHVSVKTILVSFVCWFVFLFTFFIKNKCFEIWFLTWVLHFFFVALNFPFLLFYSFIFFRFY